MGVRELSLRFESVRLMELTHEVVDLLGASAARDKSDIAVVGDAEVVVRCDRMRIEQVVTNLVRNALAFGAGKTVRVSIETAGDHVELRIADRGIGIAPQDQTRIFERFERAVSPAHYGGMGLGLYITKQIVDAHGGTIRVESALGEGATFIVALPKQGAASTPSQREG